MTQPLRTEAIKRFLMANTRADLAQMYDYNMEVQVLVGQHGGERKDTEYKGRHWSAWTDGISVWKSIRIPYNAATNPEYQDVEMKFDLSKYADGIGMTGWDWVNKVSKWVAFDFDAIVGHSEKHSSKLTNEELEEVRIKASELDWVTVRKSTSGKGLHLYVLLNDVPTLNHTEHAALGRAILGMMSGLTGFSFDTKVDNCGGNMWVWHRKMIDTDGLTVIKDGGILHDIPPNWKDHIKVTSGIKRRALPQFIEENRDETFEELTGQRVHVQLDDDHKKLIDFLREEYPNGWWWDQDHHMLVTHTFHLKKAYDELGMKGVFTTVSTGKKEGEDHNCFGGNTTVLTRSGPIRISDLVGKPTELLVLTPGGMEWIVSEIKSFGVQTTVEILFDDLSIIRATMDHQWLTYDNDGLITLDKRTPTSELLIGRTLLPVAHTDLLDPKEAKVLNVGSLRQEPVFCAVVPRYHNFTLGNKIITGNCFMFPMRKGAWSVRRYSKGIQETEIWEQDNSGYTRAYLNKIPDLNLAARSCDGMEHKKGGFVFNHAEQAVKAALMLGVDIKIPSWAMNKEAKLLQHKDGRLIVELTHDQKDAQAGGLPGWLQEKKVWQKIYNANLTTQETEVDAHKCDDYVRHIVNESGEDAGWVLRTDDEWHFEPLTNVQKAMSSLGYTPKEVTMMIGTSVFQCWKIVNRPFQPEYPGNRQWNRNSAQLAFLPNANNDGVLIYPNWQKILNHCGKGLDDAIGANPWAKANGILTGADYLKIWAASLFQYPLEPLPYLFFYGPQGSGKSTFHEALQLLLKRGTGYARADAALTNGQGFNGELEGAILCVVEETNMSRDKKAYDRIKDMVTSRDLNLHPKGGTPFLSPNSTHWIQCANEFNACPIFPGDTRITMIFVDMLTAMMSKRELFPLLEKEAPDFLAELLRLEIPVANDRLMVPVIETDDKINAQQANKTTLEIFIEENCHFVTGKMILISEFYERFIASCPDEEKSRYTKNYIGKHLPPPFVKGRNPKDAQHNYGNMSWTPRKEDEAVLPKLIVDGKGALIPQ